MTKDEIIKEVWSVIDEHSMDIDRVEYIQMMEEIIDDLKIRIEAAAEDLEAE